MPDYEDGFYWVKISEGDDWEPARYWGRYDNWNLINATIDRSSQYFHAIGPKLTPPSEETE